MKLLKSFIDGLGYDLSAAVKAHQAAIEAHRYTVDQPAPVADPLVEAIVRDGGYEIEDDTLPELEPALPDLSDRQFFQGLAEEGIISWDEAEEAVGPGTIPGELLAILTAAISDPTDLARAKVKVRGATIYRFSDELVPMVQAHKGWSDEQLRAFWLFCYGL